MKLTRALWIIPLSLMASIVFKSKSSKISIPYFIFAFVAASIVVTVAPSFKPLYGSVVHFAKIGLTITLFLIGAGLSRDTLKNVGIKPIVQGSLLWLLISVVSLCVIKSVSLLVGISS